MASMQSDTEDGVHILGTVQSLSPTSLGDPINITVQNQSLHKVGDDDCGEPLSKKAKLDDELPVDTSQSIKQILFNINRAICLRLDCIEGRLATVMSKTKILEEKVDQIHNYLRTPPNGAFCVSPDNGLSGSRKSNAVIVGVPQNREGETKASLMKFIEGDSKAGLMKLIGSQYNQTGDHAIPNLGPNVTLITLNSEEDYPDGVWLGDENNPEMRVRAPITPSDLLHIHSNCRTSEKMALTLLDYLFDRETQACSNLSGMGKHGKRQLDPLMIYGIRCHLIQRFALTEQDWHRIKQNIDSKCRTAFRRKMRGMSLQVKAFRGKSPSSYLHIDQEMLSGDDSLQRIEMEDGQLHIHEEGVDLTVGGVMSASSAADLLQGTGAGEIQVLHATPEQVAQLQQTHQIQILHGDQVIHQLQSNPQTDRVPGSVAMTSPNVLQENMHVVNSHSALNDNMHVVSSPGGLQEGIQVVSSPGGLHDGMQVVSVRTESGETIQIQTQPDDDAQDSEQPSDSDQ